MTRIAVFSDSHGRLEVFEKAVRELKDISAIVHLGDCASDAAEIMLMTGREILTINGNCDIISREPLFRKFVLDGKTVYCTHGHREHVKMGLMRLSYRAEEEQADLVLYGHTHIQSVQMIGKTCFVNPGAMKDGHYCTITIDDGAITPDLHFIRP